MARKTKAQIAADKRVAEIALAIRGCVVAMQPTQAVAAQAFSVLYQDVLTDMLSAGAPTMHDEVGITIANRVRQCFDLIVDDVNDLLTPSLKPDTILLPTESQKAYH